MLGAAMAWRQRQSYSEDLRARVLAAIDGGLAVRPGCFGSVPNQVGYQSPIGTPDRHAFHADSHTRCATFITTA